MRQWSYYYAFDNPTWSMSQYPYPVTLDWARRPTMTAWNEICAWTIEHFGLPGIRYQTEVDVARKFSATSRRMMIDPATRVVPVNSSRMASLKRLNPGSHTGL